MMMASFEGDLALQKGLGAVHSPSHPVSAIGRLKLQHGTLNAILSQQWCGPMLRCRPSPGARGVTADMFPHVVEQALLDHNHASNPASLKAESYMAPLKLVKE